MLPGCWFRFMATPSLHGASTCCCCCCLAGALCNCNCTHAGQRAPPHVPCNTSQAAQHGQADVEVRLASGCHVSAAAINWWPRQYACNTSWCGVGRRKVFSVQARKPAKHVESKHAEVSGQGARPQGAGSQMAGRPAGPDAPAGEADTRQVTQGSPA